MYARIYHLQCAVLIPVILLLAACGSKRDAATQTVITTSTAQITDTLSIKPPQTPVVIDSDMGFNGIMAILYLLQRPEFSVKAITIAGTGETHCGPGVANALGMITLLKAGDIRVACGRETPLTGDHHFPPAIRAAADSIPGISWPESAPAVSDNQLSASELLQETIQSADRPVVVLADGPLTNLAEALQANPKLVDNIQMIYSMGGAFDVPGNIFGVPLTAPNSVAEFNIFVDPHAANVVINSGASITFVPLDATNQVPLDKIFYKLLSNHQETPAAKAVYTMLTETDAYYQGLYFWDPLTYAIATDVSLAGFTTRVIAVVEEEGPEIGRTKDSQTGGQVRVAMSANTDRFVETYLSTLNGGQKISIDWAAARATPEAIITVTISGGECVSEGALQVPAGEFGIKLINNDPEKMASLAIVTIDDDKTFADLEALHSAEKPSWAQGVDLRDAQPGKETIMVAEVRDKPLYLVCFDGPATSMRYLGPIGRVELIK